MKAKFVSVLLALPLALAACSSSSANEGEGEGESSSEGEGEPVGEGEGEGCAPAGTVCNGNVVNDRCGEVVESCAAPETCDEGAGVFNAQCGSPGLATETCESLGNPFPCATGLLCLTVINSDNRCFAPIVGEGTACQIQGVRVPCESGLVCFDAACTVTDGDIDSRCDGNDDCLDLNCDEATDRCLLP
jgi:hypothetical protein